MVVVVSNSKSISFKRGGSLGFEYLKIDGASKKIGFDVVTVVDLVVYNLSKIESSGSFKSSLEFCTRLGSRPKPILKKLVLDDCDNKYLFDDSNNMLDLLFNPNVELNEFDCDDASNMDDSIILNISFANIQNKAATRNLFCR